MLGIRSAFQDTSPGSPAGFSFHLKSKGWFCGVAPLLPLEMCRDGGRDPSSAGSAPGPEGGARPLRASVGSLAVVTLSGSSCESRSIPPPALAPTPSQGLERGIRDLSSGSVMMEGRIEFIYSQIPPVPLQLGKSAGHWGPSPRGLLGGLRKLCEARCPRLLGARLLRARRNETRRGSHLWLRKFFKVYRYLRFPFGTLQRLFRGSVCMMERVGVPTSEKEEGKQVL